MSNDTYDDAFLKTLDDSQECTCEKPEVFTPPGTGQSYCQKCRKKYGEYDWNWDSMG